MKLDKFSWPPPFLPTSNHSSKDAAATAASCTATSLKSKHSSGWTSTIITSFLLVPGTLIHTHVLKSGFKANVFVRTDLVCLYAKCGVLDAARKLFDEMSERNVVSWTGMISGYLDSGRFGEGLNLFMRMLEMGLMILGFRIVKVLTSCAQARDLRTGEWICGYVKERGMDRNVFFAMSLVDLYVKCRCMERARGNFDGMVERDVVTWSIL